MSANTETTMSPAEVLEVLDSVHAKLLEYTAQGGLQSSREAEDYHGSRTAVAALIEREAALVVRITDLEERDMMLTKQIVVYAAERDALRAKVEALRADAERWRHARMLLTVDEIEGAQRDYESFGRLVSEDECKRADAAIDAARAEPRDG